MTPKLAFGTLHRPLTNDPDRGAPYGIEYHYAVAWREWLGFGIKRVKPHGDFWHKPAILVRLWPPRWALYVEFGRQ